LKRVISLFLSFLLAFSGLISSACNNSGDTLTGPTAPPPAAAAPPPPEPVSPEAVHVVSAGSDSIEIEGVDPALGGRFRLRLEGIRTERPTYYLNGVFQGELFGSGANTAAAASLTNTPLHGRVSEAVTITAAVVAALTALTLVFLIDACIGQVVLAYEEGRLDVNTGNELANGCAREAFVAITGSLAKVGAVVGNIAATIQSWLQKVSWKKLADLLATIPKEAIEETIGVVRDWLVGQLYDQAKAWIESLFAGQPPPDEPTPNPPPEPPPSPDPDPEPDPGEPPPVSCPAAADECEAPEYLVRGNVSDEQGKPIAKALLKLTGNGGTSSVETGAGGTYSLSPKQAKAGDYSLSVSAEGYESETASVKLAGQAVTRNFKLSKLDTTTTTTYSGSYTGTHTITFGSPTPACSRRHAVTGTLTITLTINESTGKASGTGELLQDDVVVALDCPTGPQMGAENSLEMNPIKVSLDGTSVTFDQSQSNSFGGSDGGGTRTERFTFDGTLTDGRIQGTLKEFITTTTTGNGSGTYSVTLKP
jgi:hypothetical protein